MGWFQRQIGRTVLNQGLGLLVARAIVHTGRMTFRPTCRALSVALACLLGLTAWHASLQAEPLAQPEGATTSGLTVVQNKPSVSCTLPGPSELIMRINMATLGDPRFRPLDERLGAIQVDYDGDGVVIQFNSRVAQFAGEWIFFYHCDEGWYDAYAFLTLLSCPGRAPRTQTEMQAMVDAEWRRRDLPALDWRKFDIETRASTCADWLQLLPISRVIHGDWEIQVQADGQIVPVYHHGSSPSVNGQLPRVKYVGR